ncbi:hypothetical protein [Clavibacter michiganensis]|uniref:hypothetical protein n=1 Tax=Clavibacter michiganensis TaxID=28447 RepID=UPI001430C8A3|nr:hypothetical protein [Clavibacter michiganensis]QIT12709.1 hypothetical protein GRD74_15110 [Clavibacter michiganensis subsp. michiganensis]
METQRVFDIANEAGVDVKAALRELEKLGSDITEPTRRLDFDLAQELRAALRLQATTSAALLKSTQQPQAHQALARPTANPTRRTARRPQATFQPMAKELLGPEHTDSTRKMIPLLYDLLLRGGTWPATDGVVVIYHDARLRPEYGVSTSSRERWTPAAGTGLTRDALLSPLRALDRRYRDRALMPPNMFIAIDVPNGRAWFSRSFHKRPPGPYLDARTLEPILEVPDGPPARLAPKAQIFHPAHVPPLVHELSTSHDEPEETFLLHEDLLQLAVDTLDGDMRLDPLPVHLNGLWVFARPVIMRRPDNSERHIRAVWYRQGPVVWRLRTFAAGIGNEPKEVGERLHGRLPFVPVWDETRPEQKLIAAVWALMSQGGVTESERRSPDTEAKSERPERGALTIVHVKAGTDHARFYRSDDPSNLAERPAWSVRGHWRNQPYPSLSRDEKGNVVRRLKWIASYTKGDPRGATPPEKVIVVHP